MIALADAFKGPIAKEFITFMANSQITKLGNGYHTPWQKIQIPLYLKRYVSEIPLLPLKFSQNSPVFTIFH